MTRLIQALLAGVVALTLAWPSAALAADNTAIAVNTKDGTTLFKVSFKIVRVNQDVVDNGNAAVAISSCTDCQSVAAAYQIVLVFSDPSVVAPVNLALAENVDCLECLAFAAAQQWVLGTGGPVHFTAEGNQALADIKQRLHDLAGQDLTLDQLRAELQEIANEIMGVLAHQLVPAGNPGGNSNDSGTTTDTITEPPATTTTPVDTTPATTTDPATTTETATTTGTTTDFATTTTP